LVIPVTTRIAQRESASLKEERSDGNEDTLFLELCSDDETATGTGITEENQVENPLELESLWPSIQELAEENSGSYFEGN
jgi:hypothetical protein